MKVIFFAARSYILLNLEMKKAIPILLLVLYTTTSFAITINVHYYGGKFSGLSLSDFGGAIHCSCGQPNSTHRRCCSDKTICVKTDNHKTVQQYRISADFSDFKVPVYFLHMSVAYPQPASPDSHYSSSGFTRSHSTTYLTFICTYRI